MSDVFEKTYKEQTHCQISLCPKDWTPDKKWVRWLLQKGDHEQVLVSECTFSVQREMAPIYTMGHKDPKAFTRCHRTVKGTLTTNYPFPTKVDHCLYMTSENEEGKPMFLYIPNIEHTGTVTLDLNDVEQVHTLHFVSQNIVPWQSLHTTK